MWAKKSENMFNMETMPMEPLVYQFLAGPKQPHYYAKINNSPIWRDNTFTKNGTCENLRSKHVYTHHIYVYKDQCGVPFHNTITNSNCGPIKLIRRKVYFCLKANPWGTR